MPEDITPDDLADALAVGLEGALRLDDPVVAVLAEDPEEVAP